MRMRESHRFSIALAILALTAALAWATMDAGRIRDGVLVVLGGFALRIALTSRKPTGAEGVREDS